MTELFPAIHLDVVKATSTLVRSDFSALNGCYAPQFATFDLLEAMSKSSRQSFVAQRLELGAEADQENIRSTPGHLLPGRSRGSDH